MDTIQFKKFEETISEPRMLLDKLKWQHTLQISWGRTSDSLHQATIAVKGDMPKPTNTTLYMPGEEATIGVAAQFV